MFWVKKKYVKIKCLRCKRKNKIPIDLYHPNLYNYYYCAPCRVARRWEAKFECVSPPPQK